MSDNPTNDRLNVLFSTLGLDKLVIRDDPSDERGCPVCGYEVYPDEPAAAVNDRWTCVHAKCLGGLTLPEGDLHSSVVDMIEALVKLRGWNHVAGYGYYGHLHAAKTIVATRAEVHIDGRGGGYIVTLAPPGPRPAVWDEGWWFDRWDSAFAAFERFDGTAEPEGWFRHQPSDRRRPDGDQAREYVRP